MRTLLNKHGHIRAGNYVALVAVLSIAFMGAAANGHGKAAQRPSLPPTGNAQNTKRLQFEVVSIRPSARGFFGGVHPQRETTEIQPDGYRAVDQPLISTIIFAYLPMSYSWSNDSKPLNQPNWASEEYDISAKVPHSDLAAWQAQGPQKEMLSAMLRSMLEERCKLSVHWITSQTQGYALVVAKHGTKFKQAVPGEHIPPNGLPVRIGNSVVPGATFFPFRKGDGRTDLPIYNVSADALAAWLALDLETTIINQTGLNGTYNVVLHRRERAGQDMQDPGPWIPWDMDALGLKLVPSKVPTKRLVIDHIERPSPN